MPSLAPTRRPGNEAIGSVLPGACGTQNSCQSEHCVQSLDNLSCKAVPILLVTSALVRTASGSGDAPLHA